MTIAAYIRVSTSSQNSDSQRREIKQWFKGQGIASHVNNATGSTRLPIGATNHDGKEGLVIQPRHAENETLKSVRLTSCSSDRNKKQKKQAEQSNEGRMVELMKQQREQERQNDLDHDR